MAATKKKPAHAAGKSTRSATKPTPAQRADQKHDLTRIIGGCVCFFLALIVLVSYTSETAVGIDRLRSFFTGLLGYGYYLLAVVLIVAGVHLTFHRESPAALGVTAILLLPLFLSAAVHLFACKVDFSEEKSLIGALYTHGKELRCGGVLGGLPAVGLKALLGKAISAILLLGLSGASFYFGLKHEIQTVAARMRERRAAAEAAREDEPVLAAPDEAERAAVDERVSRRTSRRAARAIDIPTEDDAPAEPYQEKKVGFFNAAPRTKTPDQVYNTPDPVPEAAPAPAAPVPAPAPLKPQPSPTANVEPASIEEVAAAQGIMLAKPEDAVKAEGFSTSEVRDMRSNAKNKISGEELQSETDEVAEAIAQKDAAPAQPYNYPPADLLRRGTGTVADTSEEVRLNCERLQSALNSFGVSATITDTTSGPTVTRYDLKLDAGVKLSKLTNLSGDLALALGVTGVRIAPIPNRESTVGIEVPNKIVSTVYLRDIIDTDVFRSASSRLTFALGKDISGSAVVGNIAKLPHLLIAGTTGSGKSVCMNSLILSLLYKAKPEEVRLIMIDPKMVELGIYNGIPHLYIPVVTDPKKAAGSLQWAVVEMLKRYRLFSEVGVRDLAAYNTLQKARGEQTLPQVVIVIDELADLMMTAAKEVEESICRVAQMGRAAGMHLVIATQRPSADVITGLMKANIPSRIAFAVSSAMESRIILDQAGAEKLVGMGDMLYAPLGIGKPTRIQGAFVSDDEREEVVNFIKQNGEAEYSEEIIAAVEKAAEEKSDKTHAESVDEPDAGGDFDEMLPQAVEVIFETKQASVSMLQRRLKLGYSRAARIVDQMEELGVVGPFEGSKPRKILLTREQWQEMQNIHGTAPIAPHSDDQLSFGDIQSEDAPVEEWSEPEA